MADFNEEEYPLYAAYIVSLERSPIFKSVSIKGFRR